MHLYYLTIVEVGIIITIAQKPKISRCTGIFALHGEEQIGAKLAQFEEYGSLTVRK